MTEETTERIRTGLGVVDDVIVTVEALDQQPVEEHVVVYEAAHEQLRSALDLQQ